MDEYDHIYRKCPGEDLCRARTLGTAAIEEKWQELPSGENPGTATPGAIRRTDCYRVGLGDLTRLQKQRLQIEYMRLERPTDRDADATFLCQILSGMHAITLLIPPLAVGLKSVCCLPG